MGLARRSPGRLEGKVERTGKNPHRVLAQYFKELFYAA